MTGLIDTNGDAAEPASRIALPVTECLAALHAFGGIGAAVWSQRTQGLVQNVEVALFDCAFAASASFLAKFVADGDTPTRVGNRHPMTLPWNVYKASDEWVLICTSSNDHWQRLAEVMGDRRLIEDDELRTAAGRARRADELDAAIAAWVSDKTAEECVDTIADLAIPCATIAPFDGYPMEANLEHRGQICRLHDPATDQDVFVPGPVIRTLDRPGRSPAAIPSVNSAPKQLSNAVVCTIAAQSAQSSTRPLKGLRVIEVGSLTTGPLCGRMLAALGANVIKVEPPSGDPMRHMPPLQHGQGVFFSYYNTDKQAVSLDLKSQADRAQLAALLGTADVLVQNLKEGAFARMGFTLDHLAAINPRLVRCDISGFGSNSIYQGPARGRQHRPGHVRHHDRQSRRHDTDEDRHFVRRPAGRHPGVRIRACRPDTAQQDRRRSPCRSCDAGHCVLVDTNDLERRPATTRITGHRLSRWHCNHVGGPRCSRMRIAPT